MAPELLISALCTGGVREPGAVVVLVRAIGDCACCC
jgi:hypothetical protein